MNASQNTSAVEPLHDAINRLEAENHRLTVALEDITSGATACERCGVTYTDYTGPCQELIGVREPYSTCPGVVSVRGVAKVALA